jgi:hypothetical protein
VLFPSLGPTSVRQVALLVLVIDDKIWEPDIESDIEFEIDAGALGRRTC